MTNIYADANRALKVQQLIKMFRSHNVPSIAVEYLDENGWQVAARVAKVNNPSTATRNAVVIGLRIYENSPADPFTGLLASQATR